MNSTTNEGEKGELMHEITEPGLRQLVLLNSAGFDIAQLPLNGTVSLIGDNNKGKTTIINALQFMMVVDRGRMNFHPKTLTESKKYYFKTNCSYILLEVHKTTRAVLSWAVSAKG